jgi:hypothetical protein
LGDAERQTGGCQEGETEGAFSAILRGNAEDDSEMEESRKIFIFRFSRKLLIIKNESRFLKRLGEIK